MANAKKCDRCGAYYQECEANAIQSLANTLEKMLEPKTTLQIIGVIERCLDLCPGCSESLKRWAKGKEDAEDGK